MSCEKEVLEAVRCIEEGGGAGGWKMDFLRRKTAWWRD